MSKFKITIINDVTNQVKEKIIIHHDIDKFSKILNNHEWTLIYYEKILHVDEGGEINMPKKDGQGPPKTSQGPKDGHGGGGGNQSGQGSGPKTGGEKGDCK